MSFCSAFNLYRYVGAFRRSWRPTTTLAPPPSTFLFSPTTSLHSSREFRQSGARRTTRFHVALLVARSSSVRLNREFFIAVPSRRPPRRTPQRRSLPRRATAANSRKKSRTRRENARGGIVPQTAGRSAQKTIDCRLCFSAVVITI